MKPTYTGKSAESAVGKYLGSLGYQILEQNWRTKTCEIDLVAKKDGIIYFVEVKYRINDSQGNGFDYITPGKLKQMGYAAQVWTSENNWDDDYRLMAAAVSGENYESIEAIEI